MGITNKYQRLPVNSVIIERDKRQRREFTTEDIEPSIKLRGVLQPIIVEKRGEELYLIAGERRLTASRNLRLPDIPARFVTELSTSERKIIELEENLRRLDLPWKDEAIGLMDIHQTYVDMDPEWTQLKTADAIGMQPGNLSIALRVAEEIKAGNKIVLASNGIRPAYNAIARGESRRIGDVLNELLEGPAPAPVKQAEVIHITPAVKVHIEPSIHKDSIHNVDFLTWIDSYIGPPFPFVHCDFPYGIGLDKSAQANSHSYDAYEDSEDTYWKLLEAFCRNISKIMAPSSHLLFWLSSDIYRQYETLEFFRAHAPEIDFRPVPITWHKTDNRGILPDPKRGPRQVTETALIGSRGDRHIIKAVSNCYGAPTAKEFHQSEKPEPMLRHFFQMFVDEFTRMFDPTCGSGTSLRAAESLGAPDVVGLEINPEFCEGARTALRKFRNLRALEKK